MAKPRVAFGAVPGGSKEPPQNLNEWVEAKPSAQEQPLTDPGEPMKRLTIEIGQGLHKKFKARCVDQDVNMADIVRQLIESWVAKDEA